MRNQKGITLIALVITIIVLLILAGVSIAMLTGQNGILNQATNAKDETAEAEVVERINMELNAIYADVLRGGVTFDDDYVAKINTNLGGKAEAELSSGTITISGVSPYASITGNVNTTARTIDPADMPS